MDLALQVFKLQNKGAFCDLSDLRYCAKNLTCIYIYIYLFIIIDNFIRF